MRLLIPLLLALSAPVIAKDKYGPYKAEVLRIIDGDTVELNVRVWPQLTQRIKLRLDGVNTPQKRGRGVSDCEKEAGQKATNFTQKWLPVGEIVTLKQVRLGKYAGRALGQIWKGGASLGDALIKAGHAKPYTGGKREPWC